MEAPFPTFTGERPERRESWSWGPARRQNKLEIIETELQSLVRHGLDGLWVFHTFFHRWVTLLAERTRPMWEYSGPTYPDRVSPDELSRDEVWSYLDRVVRFTDDECLEGTLRPLHTMKLSDLVYSFLVTFFLSILIFRSILSCLFRRGSRAINLSRIF